MKSLLQLLYLSLTFALSACGGGTSESQVAQITEYGLYTRGTEVVVPDPNSPSGFSRITTGRTLTAQTQNVPLTLGVLFGLRFAITGYSMSRPPDVAVRVAHPPMVNASGVTTTTFEARPAVQLQAGAYTGSFGYGFDHQFELVPGTWYFTVVIDGRDAVTQEFHAR
jgi:Domain of unknown function (DUF3859)